MRGREKGLAPARVAEASARPRGTQLGWQEGSTLAVPQAWAVAGGQRLCEHRWPGLTRHTRDLVRSQAPHAPDLFLGDTLRPMETRFSGGADGLLWKPSCEPQALSQVNIWPRFRQCLGRGSSVGAGREKELSGHQNPLYSGFRWLKLTQGAGAVSFKDLGGGTRRLPDETLRPTP